MVIFAVAKHTARILWNRKLWGCAVCFMLVCLSTALWFLQLGPGIEGRLLVDVEMAGIELLGFAGAVLAFAILGFEEQELRTVWLILSKPIRRSEYVAGKLLGIIGVLLANFMIMGSWMVLMNMSLMVPLTAVHGWALGAVCLKWMVVVAAIGVVSVWASSAVSLMMLGSMVILIGHVIHHLNVLLRGPMNGVVKIILTLLYYAFPNFHYLNVRDILWSDPLVTWQALGVMGGYSAMYAVCAVGVACVLYGRKEFL